jgi:hypothetical protein
MVFFMSPTPRRPRIVVDHYTLQAPGPPDDPYTDGLISFGEFEQVHSPPDSEAWLSEFDEPVIV